MTEQSNTRVKVLIADSLPRHAVHILTVAGLEAHSRTGMSEDELCSVIGEYDGLIVRSATQVTPRVLDAGVKLRVIGRAGVGVDNIDVEAATAKGVLVMNTPLGNIQSAAEHTIAMLFAMARKVAFADQKMKAGEWPKKQSVGTEFRGKTLGVIGLGRIGRMVVGAMSSVGMRILVYDPFLTDEAARELDVERVELDQLLADADFITVHTPLTDATRGMLGAEAFRKMKKSARIVNCARGGIVDEAALVTALEAGEIAGAALDVFETEPLPADSPLRGAPGMVLTPHLGASTEEAQLKVAEDIAHQFATFLREGRIQNAVNLSVVLDPNVTVYAELAECIGRLAAQMVDGPVTRLECCFNGKVVNEHARTLAVFVLKGLLGEGSDEAVNLVNAPHMAQRRGIKLVRQAARESTNFLNQIAVTAHAASEVSVRGTVFDETRPHIVGLWDYNVEFKPAPYLLILRYKDRPGMVGRFGTILGDAGVNIADMAVGRNERGKEAAAALTLDDPVPEQAMNMLSAVEDYPYVRMIKM